MINKYALQFLISFRDFCDHLVAFQSILSESYLVCVVYCPPSLAGHLSSLSLRMIFSHVVFRWTSIPRDGQLIFIIIEWRRQAHFCIGCIGYVISIELWTEKNILLLASLKFYIISARVFIITSTFVTAHLPVQRAVILLEIQSTSKRPTKIRSQEV